ncbi:Skt5p [Rhizophagus irregularis DAOM 197198w]|uniref:Skt5p n=1 Tax=Rhizophagus irregularis (strain DAOM 197198w) TaxID=1432141 RepID=A0A015JA76_RHIIW|nr:Skt5p [Rhizophagus irregularis DAOM 197198w]
MDVELQKINLAASQCIIGYCYSNGAGIKKDLKIAFHWYEKAAGNGNIIAMYNLGYSYKKGIGVEKDVNKAIYWYRKSAEQGYEYAQNEIEKLTKKK